MPQLEQTWSLLASELPPECRARAVGGVDHPISGWTQEHSSDPCKYPLYLLESAASLNVWFPSITRPSFLSLSQTCIALKQVLTGGSAGHIL